MKTRHQRFMSVARAMARASEASDLKVGAVIVGFSGVVAGVGFNIETNAPDPTVLHAETMALAMASSRRASDDTLYTTTSPCLACAKKIVGSDSIKAVYYQHEWWDEAALRLLNEHGIKTVQIKREGRQNA